MSLRGACVKLQIKPLVDPFEKNLHKINEMMRNGKALSVTPVDFLSILVFAAKGDFVTSELIDILKSKNILTAEEHNKLDGKIINSNNEAHQFMEYLIDRYIGSEGSSDE